MTTTINNIIIDITAIGKYKTGYYTYATFVIDQIWNSNLFSDQDICLIITNKSCISEYIKRKKIDVRRRGKIKIKLIPSIHPLLRILYCTVYISFLSLTLRNTSVFSPVNFGPLFCFAKHYLFLHDLSVWGLSQNIQHRSRISKTVIQLCISTSSIFAYKVFCQSNFTRGILLNKFPRFKDKASVLYLPYPAKMNQVQLLVDKVSVSPSTDIIPNNILYVSSFYPLKNQLLLIKAARLLPEFNFTIVGKPIHSVYYEECEDLAASLANVMMRTNCDDSELKLIYKNTDIYVQPSFFEGLSFTPLEAASYGCILLLSDIDAHREFYSNSCLSFFDPKNLDSFLKSIKKVSSNSALYHSNLPVIPTKQFSPYNHTLKLNSVLSSKSNQ